MMKKTTVFCVLATSVAVHALADAGLRAPVMEPLKLGEVKPLGALRATLETQRDGLTGHAEEIYRDIGESDWLTNAGKGGEYSWERGPYYARGLIASAFTLGDEALKEKARKWVDAALGSQLPNGDFGPRRLNWWANMLPQWYLTDWADATGDARVVPFLEKYYRFQREELKKHPFCADSCWPVARTGDEIASVLWLYAKTKNPEWLDFARFLAPQSADWTTYYHDGGYGGVCCSGGIDGPKGELARSGYRCHIVNFMQGLKFPALKWLLGGDERDRTAAAAAFDPAGWVMRKCGRPDAMVNGSEPLTDRSTTGGTELCAIAERINSIRFVAMATGAAQLGDDLEDVAYNALPATVYPDGRGVRYYLILNQPCCVDKGLLFSNNGFGREVTGAICPGPHSGYGCCRANWHIAWPKFVQTMWMRKDGGLVAFAHGPSRVETEVAGARTVLEEETDFPYGGHVKIRVVEAKGTFPIFVRIPRWAKVSDAGTFRRYERAWKAGDVIDVDFPMEPEVSFWGQRAAAVRRGPLLYAWPLKETRREIKDYAIPYDSAKAWVKGGLPGFPRWELTSQDTWNHVLKLSRDGKLVGAEVVGDGRDVGIRVPSTRTGYAGWGTMRADAQALPAEPPESPVDARRCSGNETLVLRPLALTQLRITLFPWTAE